MDAHAADLVSAEPFSLADRLAVYRAILTRRDVRGEFLPDAVSDAVLSRILIAAHHAPSVGFMQPWSFVLIRDAAAKRRVHAVFHRANAEAALMFPDDRRAAYRALKLEGILEAPINLCVTCDRDRTGSAVIGRTHMPAMDLYSAVCAVQNLWLAARSEGLGVGWVSIMDEAELKSVLGIPDPIVVVAYLCIGRVTGYHPRPELETVGWRARLEVDAFVHFDAWGGERPDDPLLIRLRADQKAVGDGAFLGDRP